MSTLNRGRYDGEDTPAEMEREQERKRMWREELGVEAPEWQDESDAPPVDEQLLRQYVRNELAEAVARRVDSLVAKYKSWSRAENLIGVEEFRKGHN